MRIGAFELDRLVGQGGIGQVWLGHHPEHDVPVAVKILGRHLADNAVFRRSFANEVRAVAALNHPGIVLLLDCGEVTAAEAAQAEADVVEHAPWLAMEYASGGTLHNRNHHPRTWSALRAILLKLLDALAHAHARDVVHRDLKPANVLVFRADDARPGLRLSDFGLASSTGVDTADVLAAAGTVGYCPPEQIVGAWRRFGPWTDLYALGMLGWRLATGEAPFGKLRGPRLAYAQLQRDPADFVPRFDVPTGFEPWLRRLFAKAPEARWRRAADAAWALRGLDPTSMAPGDGREPDVSAGDMPTLVYSQHSGHALPTRRLPWQRGLRVGRPGDAPPRFAPWQLPHLPHLPPRLLGAGRGLQAVRTPRFVGREAERELLWGLLRRTIERGEPHVAIVRGPVGSGRTRLATWIAERAAELGHVRIVRVPSSVDAHGWSGVRRACLRVLEADDLAGDELAEAIDRWLSHRTDDAQLALAFQAVLEGGADLSARTPAVRDLMQLAARERPLLVVVPDLGTSPEALRLVAELLRSPGTGFPILVLGVVADDAPLPDVAAHARAHTVEIGPLSPAERVPLMRELLPLDPGTASRLEALAGGLPLLTVEVLNDWVRRGALVPTASGFALSGAEPPIPESLLAVFDQRCQAFLAGRDPADGVDLERAAVLGARVSAAEWTQACGTPGTPGTRREALQRDLAQASIVRPADPGFVWTHPLLRDALWSRAERAGRLPAHLAACRPVLEGAGDPLRLATLLASAGERVDALATAAEALHEAKRAPDPDGAAAAATLMERLLAELGVDPADERWGQAWVNRAWAAYFHGHRPQALEDANRALEAADRHGWSAEITAAALFRCGILLQEQRETGEAQARLERALELYRELGDPRYQAMCRLRLAKIADLERDDARAVRLRREARREAEGASGIDEQVADLIRQEAQYAMRTGDLDGAERLYEEALGRYGTVRRGVSAVTNDLADIARLRGDLETAEAGFLRANEVDARAGRRGSVFAMLNLTLVRMQRDRFPEARQALRSAMELAELQQRTVLVGTCHLLALPLAAEAADWDAWDRHLREGQDRIRRFRVINEDSIWPLEEAARRAAAHPERAAQALRLAADARDSMGQPEEAAALRARADAATGSGPPAP